jgi:hypothetical protein
MNFEDFSVRVFTFRRILYVLLGVIYVLLVLSQRGGTALYRLFALGSLIGFGY